MKKLFMCIVAVALVLTASVWGAAAKDKALKPKDRDRDSNVEFVPGEVVIGFPLTVTASQINEALASVGGTVISQIIFSNTKVLRVRLADATAAGTEAAVKKLMENPALMGKIKYAEPNIIRRPDGEDGYGDAVGLTQSNDPSLSEQWGYYDIGAHFVQPVGTQKYIAVLDTGVDYNHPELVGKVVKGKDFVNNDLDPMDDHGHGTHVSGIAAAKANNAFGITGVAWTAKILAVKVLSSQGPGTVMDVANGIKYAADNTYVRVINMSLGGPYSATEQIAVDYAVNTKKKLLVASAGNSASSSMNYPAAFSLTFPGKVIAVAAHQPDSCKADFSSYGTWVSISAPGVGILSTVPGWMYPGSGGFEWWQGTSMAAPFVAGAAEVLWAKYPTYTNTQIANLLTTTAHPLERDGVCWPKSGDGTYGKLSLVNAMTGGLCSTAVTTPYGYASDASNGEPLSGAKVQALQGTTIKGTDYVPYYGYMARDDGLVYEEGYGLFTVPASPITASTVDAKITKTGYVTYTAKYLPYNYCSFTYAGNIPIPPTSGLYWVAVTTDYGQTDLYFDLYGKHPNGTYVGYDAEGDLNASPYMKWLWDSDYENDPSWPCLRQYSETIRIKTQATGTYKFFVQDWVGDGTHWSIAGMKAYIYRGTTLVKVITPTAGVGYFWYIADINGSTVTEVNILSDYYP